MFPSVYVYARYHVVVVLCRMAFARTHAQAFSLLLSFSHGTLTNDAWSRLATRRLIDATVTSRAAFLV